MPAHTSNVVPTTITVAVPPSTPSSSDCEMFESPHLHAKILNNRGSRLISTGDYDEGISTLTRALKLTQGELQDSNNHDHDTISPCSCMLDAFLEDDDDIVVMKCNERGEDRDTVIDGFVYFRPLSVSQHCIKGGHHMGLVLSVTILFNLALAHHAKATATMATATVDMQGNNEGDDNNVNRNGTLQQAIKLYELAHQLHAEWLVRQPSSTGDDDDGNDQAEQLERGVGLFSLRFTMIVSNNLGEIYRAVGNKARRDLCLRHLLSSIMYTVERDLGAFCPGSTEMDGFCRNCYHLLPGTNAVCAAAA